jgi:predicted RNA-binding Zn ribbon-like protein
MEELCLDFINTRWYLTHELNREILADPVLLQEFLQKRQLETAAVPSREVADRLLAMRSFLAEALEDYYNSGSVSQQVLAQVNHYLSKAHYVRALVQADGITLRLQPVTADWNWVMTEIAASFAELIERKDNTRLRMCANPDCKWFFADTTRSRTKRWCDNRCASLMKVRNFRARHKKTGVYD